MGHEVLNSALWCDLNDLRVIVEHNPNALLILIGCVGFVFWRLIIVILQVMIHARLYFRRAALEAKAAGMCEEVYDHKEQRYCKIDAVNWLIAKATSWWAQLYLNVAALLLTALGVVTILLVLYPPSRCAVSDGVLDPRITVPGVFQKVQNRDGELLFADPTNHSFLRVWPGKTIRADLDELETQYFKKLRAAKLDLARGTKPDSSGPPTRARPWFYVSWQNNGADITDTYYAARLVRRQNGSTTIDAFELTTTVHGHILIRSDYRVLLCSFVGPVSKSTPDGCAEELGLDQPETDAQRQARRQQSERGEVHRAQNQ
jgi:hypothetical protein